MFHFAIIENLTIIINHKLPLLYRNQDKLRIKTPKLALDNYQGLSSLQPKQIKTKSWTIFMEEHKQFDKKVIDDRIWKLIT